MASLLYQVLTIATLLSHVTAAGGKPPNIVILYADDLGIGDIGCFGNTTLRTPNIDKIAREGAKLTQHLAAAAICTPSRAALLTGRYPVRSGMAPLNFIRVNLFPSAISGLPPSEITFAEMAKEKGYTTAAIGKWHLGMDCETYRDFCHHPLKQGFDYFYGLPLSNAKDFGDDDINLTKSRVPYIDGILIGIAVGAFLFMYSLHRLGLFGKWVIVVTVMPLAGLCLCYYWLYNYGILVTCGIVMRDYDVVEQPIRINGFTKRLVYEGEQFLDARQQDGKPFLLYLPWTQVHTVMHASKQFQGGSKHGPYGDDVEEMDWSVGRILQKLEALGMKDNTFVYFSADNGGHLEETGPKGNQEGGWNGIYRGGKGQGGMDGGIRMPTVAMWPGKIPPGTVVDVPTSQMDVFATVAAMLGLPLPADRVMDGVDIMPVLRGESRPPPHEFLFHYCGEHIHAARYTPADGKGDVWKAFFITPNWLPGTDRCDYVCNCDGSGVTIHNPPILYNIGKDPSEKTALDLQEPRHQAVVEKLIQAVAAHKGSVVEVPSQFQLHRLLPRPWLQPCCGGGHFPFCSCVDAVHEHLIEK